MEKQISQLVAGYKRAWNHVARATASTSTIRTGLRSRFLPWDMACELGTRNPGQLLSLE